MPAKQVVVFNGPPGCGKDHISRKMCALGDLVCHMEFKQHLYSCTSLLFNVNHDWFMGQYNDRLTKDIETCMLYGMSPRQAMIYTAEEVIKPNFGQDYFGRIVAENMEYGLTVISDGGFEGELDPVYEECDGRMLIVQVHRDTCNYDNDSRGYINEFRDVPIVKVFNNSTIENYENSTLGLIEDWLLTIEEG